MNTGTEPTAVLENQLAPDTSAHPIVRPYAVVVPTSKLHEATGAPSGLTEPYRAAEVRFTAEADSVAAPGAIFATTNVNGFDWPGLLPIVLGWVATAVYSPNSRVSA